MTTSQKFFASIRKWSLIAALLGISSGIGTAFVLHQPDVKLKNQNEIDGNNFDTAKQVIDKVNGAFVAKFTATTDLNAKMAQRGHLALIDKPETQKLFGYKELERIITTKTIDISNSATTKRHVFPEIKLAVLVFAPEGNSCTTLVKYSADGRTQSLLWKWQRKNRTDEWKTDSLPSNYSANDVEISRDGISFVLVSKETLNSSPVYVLQNDKNTGGNNGSKKIDIRTVP